MSSSVSFSTIPSPDDGSTEILYALNDCSFLYCIEARSILSTASRSGFEKGAGNILASPTEVLGSK